MAGNAETHRFTEEQKQILRRWYRKKRKKEIIRAVLVTAVVLLAAALLIFRHFRESKPSYTVAEGELEVHFIDVGQGDCTLIMCGGESLLIDCGEDDVHENVTEYLRGCGVERLDHIVATHPHADHMGGMYAIIDSFEVGEVIMPHLSDEDVPSTVFFERFLDSCAEKGVELTEAQVGRELPIGTARAEIIAPNSPKYEEMNDYSVCLLLRLGEVSFLFTGDAERTSELEMLQGGRLSHVTVYKAGHHGSSYSGTAELLAAITPDIAVISCGDGNPYGHPGSALLKRLEGYTDRIYRTDKDGTVVVKTDGESVSVSTEVGRK